MTASEETITEVEVLESIRTYRFSTMSFALLFKRLDAMSYPRRQHIEDCIKKLASRGCVHLVRSAVMLPLGYDDPYGMTVNGDRYAGLQLVAQRSSARVSFG